MEEAMRIGGADPVSPRRKTWEEYKAAVQGISQPVFAMVPRLSLPAAGC